jgi:hypothetical protein
MAAAVHTAPTRHPAWVAFAAGFLAASVLGGAAALLLRPGQAPHTQPDAALLATPFWSGFAQHGRTTAIAVSTPLFFRSTEGYARDYRLNFPADLEFQEKLLPSGYTWPIWNMWVSLSDLKSTERLARLFRTGGADVAVLGAREITSEQIRRHPAVFLGHPRGSQLLLETLSAMPFYVSESPGEPVRGIINRSPRPGEPAAYLPGGSTALELVSENHPDHGLITFVSRPNAAPVLSIFGNRYATTELMVNRLTDPEFLLAFQKRLFGSGTLKAGSYQAVVKVNYLNGTAVDAEFLTGRAVPAN